MGRKSGPLLVQAGSHFKILDNDEAAPSPVDSESTLREYEVVPLEDAGGYQHTINPDIDRPDGFSLKLHPLPGDKEVIISIYPPKEPLNNETHVPCNLCLVIDISRSMGAEASIKNKEGREQHTGLTILGLVKHAVRAIIESMDDSDYLGVIVFSSEARVLQQMLPITTENQRNTWERVLGLEASGMTDQWQGILQAIKLFDGFHRLYSMSRILLLTDGQDCPNRGYDYISKLGMFNLQAEIHTMGFSYNIDSALLKTIANARGGNFAFIPESSTLVTVNVNTVASLQSTFATKASLTISVSEGLALVETMGYYIRGEKAKTQLTIPLGSIQYGQSRDIMLKYGNPAHANNIPKWVQAELQCQPIDGSIGGRLTLCNTPDIIDLSMEQISYHRLRLKVGSFLNSLAPLSIHGEYVSIFPKCLSHEDLIKNSTFSKRLKMKQRDLEDIIGKSAA